MVAKCKFPKEASRRIESKIAEKWNIQKNFDYFDNSKVIRRKQTNWKPPITTQFKLNLDGTTRGGKVVVGSVLRDDDGEVLLLYSGNIGRGKNNMFEAIALLWGLQVIKDMQIKDITIEGDSKIIIDMVKGVSQLSWTIQTIITNIRQLLEGLERFELQHIYREGNAVAGVIATIGFDLNEKTY